MFCEKLSASRCDGDDQTDGDQHLKEQDSYTTSLYWDTVLVEEYIYLSIHTEIRLSWKTNTETVHNKGINRLYFLRKLKSF